MKKIILFLLILGFFINCNIFNRMPKSEQSFYNHIVDFPELNYIIKKNNVNRLDIAYLFSMYLIPKEKINFNRIPLDLKLHFYPSLAYSSVNFGIMSLFPDGSFKPDELIQKYQLAIFISRYIATVDPFFDMGIKAKQIRDINSDFFAYKPINIVIARNIMELDNEGNFYPYAYISGKDAIKFLYRLESFYK